MSQKYLQSDLPKIVDSILCALLNLDVHCHGLVRCLFIEENGFKSLCAILLVHISAYIGELNAKSLSTSSHLHHSSKLCSSPSKSHDHRSVRSSPQSVLSTTTTKPLDSPNNINSTSSFLNPSLKITTNHMPVLLHAVTFAERMLKDGEKKLYLIFKRAGLFDCLRLMVSSISFDDSRFVISALRCFSYAFPHMSDLDDIVNTFPAIQKCFKTYSDDKEIILVVLTTFNGNINQLNSVCLKIAHEEEEAGNSDIVGTSGAVRGRSESFSAYPPQRGHGRSHSVEFTTGAETIDEGYDSLLKQAKQLFSSPFKPPASTSATSSLHRTVVDSSTKTSTSSDMSSSAVDGHSDLSLGGSSKGEDSNVNDVIISASCIASKLLSSENLEFIDSFSRSAAEYCLVMLEKSSHRNLVVFDINIANVCFAIFSNLVTFFSFSPSLILFLRHTHRFISRVIKGSEFPLGSIKRCFGEWIDILSLISSSSQKISLSSSCESDIMLGCLEIFKICMFKFKSLIKKENIPKKTTVSMPMFESFVSACISIGMGEFFVEEGALSYIIEYLNIISKRLHLISPPVFSWLYHPNRNGTCGGVILLRLIQLIMDENIDGIIYVAECLDTIIEFCERNSSRELRTCLLQIIESLEKYDETVPFLRKYAHYIAELKPKDLEECE
ncbi:hypothetical protein ADUPG1_011813 [Aduncisulcus paluster]|uniref:Uncharacterized protein n=1 Tax=Aduncisulcus paluster TaxID=2918883 RepID=A0ABQ5JY32_9EUKA|nr:hypothetical protein ADUPG1_011813 [Aduncisulcus paluster]